MEILVVNDDGIESYGIKLLASKLIKYGNVTAIAPDKERSAASHSINIISPLSLDRVEDIYPNVTSYKTNGTPVDCVRLATGALNKHFDIVFSGINNGLNIGTDIIYSGTVAAAREAYIEGMASVAVSCDRKFDIVLKEIDEILDLVFNKNLYSKDHTVNINFPIHEFEESKGIKYAIQGKKRFKTTYELKNGAYVVLKDEITYDDNPLTDAYLSLKGYTTITFLDVNLSKEISDNLF